MASRVGALVWAITADTREFNTHMKRASKNVSDQEKQFMKAQKSVRNFFRSLGGAAVAYASVQGLKALAAAIRNVTSASATLVEAGRRVGFATERLELLGRVVQGEGGSLSGLISGLDRFNNSIAEAADGTATYLDLFDKVGVSVRDGTGAMKDSETIFNEIVANFDRLNNSAERAQVIQGIFGKSSRALNNVLMDNNSTLKSREDAFRKLGVSTQEENQALKDLEQSFTDLGNAWGQFIKNVVISLQEEVKLAVELLTDLVVLLGKVPQLADKAVTSVSTGQYGVNLDIERQIRAHAQAVKMIGERLAPPDAEFAQRLIDTLGGKADKTAAQVSATRAKAEADAIKMAQDAEAKRSKEKIDAYREFIGYQKRINDLEDVQLRKEEQQKVLNELRVKLKQQESEALLQGITDADRATAQANARRTQAMINRVRAEGLRSPGATVTAQREQIQLIPAEVPTELATKVDELNQYFSVTASRLETIKDVGRGALEGLNQQTANLIINTDSWAEGLRKAGQILLATVAQLVLQEQTLKKIFGGSRFRTTVFQLPKRERGGPVSAGQSYLVGESGPEIFNPVRSGYITPNSATQGSGASVQLNFASYSNDPTAVIEQARAQLIPEIRAIVEGDRLRRKMYAR